MIVESITPYRSTVHKITCKDIEKAVKLHRVIDYEWGLQTLQNNDIVKVVCSEAEWHGIQKDLRHYI